MSGEDDDDDKHKWALMRCKKKSFCWNKVAGDLRLNDNFFFYLGTYLTNVDSLDEADEYIADYMDADVDDVKHIRR